MKPRLFISHASHHTPSNQRLTAVREHLYAALTADWNVFLELRSVVPGQRWRAEVLASLAEAQAAVILFDPYAANISKWVPAEALVLCFKKSLDPRFQLLPVFFKGVDAKTTSLGQYEPYGLTETQALLDDEVLDPQQLASQIAGRLNPQLAVAGLPRRGWVAEVVERLKDRQQSLSLAADALGIDAQDLPLAAANWVDASSMVRQALGQRLHEHESLSECLAAIGSLMDPMTREERESFARYLYAKWVPNQAVETLLSSARNPKQRGLLALNSSDAVIFGYYASRASIEMRPTIVHVVSVSDATGDDDESMFQAAVDAVKKKVLKRMLLDEVTGRELSIPGAVSAQLAKGDQSVLCCLPRRFAKQAVIDRLRADFPAVVFVLTGEMNELQTMTALGASALKPPLDPPLLNNLGTLENGLTPIL